MFGDLHLVARLANVHLATVAVSLVNLIPLPYNFLPVQVAGYTMHAHRFDRYLALWLLKLRQLEPYDSDLIAELCQPGMVAIDIGANLGYYTLLLAQRVGEMGKVWAFEPDPDNFASLTKNITTNYYRNIIAIPSAVGAKTEHAQLYVSTAHGGDHRIYNPSEKGRAVIDIDMAALDDFFAPGTRIDVIKMDIQGAEGLALAGMQRVLAENSNIILLMEFWPEGLTQAHTDPSAFLKDLQRLDFRVEAVDERAKKTIPITSPAAYIATLKQGAYQTILARR